MRCSKIDCPVFGGVEMHCYDLWMMMYNGEYVGHIAYSKFSVGEWILRGMIG